jgi:hypothetical protein
VQEVRRLVTAGDRSAVLEYITAPAADELAEAAKWFAKGGRTLLTQDLDWRFHGNISLDDSHCRSSVRELVTVAVSAPADAARFLPWREMAWSRNGSILMLLDVMVSKGDDWCRRFVAAAVSRNSKAGQDRATTVIRYCLPLIHLFGVSTADFEAYPRLWAFYYRDLVGGRIHEVWNDEIAAQFEYPGWSGVAFRIGPAGRAVVFPKMQKSLLELWDQDVTAATTLLRCFEVPDALGPLAMERMPEDWTVGAAVRGYVDRGTFSSEEVFGKLRTALSRDDGLPTQRVLAGVLKSCQPSPGEVAASIPLLLSTVATAPGFLSFLILGLLLGAPLSDGDLQDLSAAVFGRSEKKPQELLIRHLKSLPASGTYDDGVLAACWAVAAGSSDLKIRTMAESMLGVSTNMVLAEQPLAVSLWGTGASQPPEVPPYVALEIDPAKPLPRWDRDGEHTVAEEQYVDRFLRAVYHAPQKVRDWYGRRYPLRDREVHGPLPRVPDHWAYSNPGTVLTMWASGEHDLSAHRFLTETVQASLSGPFRWHDPFCRLNVLAGIRVLRHSELAVQAGLVPYSLATPSRSDFRVEPERLVSLLQLYAREGWQYGEADLFQALLRLGPVDRRLATSVPELPVGPLDGSDDPQRLAGQILRDWFGKGGFTPPSVDEPLVLPIPLKRFPSIPPDLLSTEMWAGGEDWRWRDWPTAATVVPFWSELGGMWSRQSSFHGDLVCRRYGHMQGATAGGIGLLTHEWLITKLAALYPDDREDAVDTMLELGRRRLLQAGHLGAAAQSRLKAGQLPLGRVTRSLALVAYEGHLDSVWPALTALVETAVVQRRIPAGTPELLATCTELWAAIPSEQRTSTNVPAKFTAAVLKLAEAKTTTKTSMEAKRLLAQMGAGFSR